MTAGLLAAPSALSHLEGSAAPARVDADRLQRLDAEDRPLLARYDLATAARTLTPAALASRRRGGMWRWAELLPVRVPAHVVHLGEGATPLLEVLRLGAHLGVPRLLVKAEGANPTGSFKARGMAAAVSRAVELGVRSFVTPSAGNAGGALAAYAAAAGARGWSGCGRPSPSWRPWGSSPATGRAWSRSRSPGARRSLGRSTRARHTPSRGSTRRPAPAASASPGRWGTR